MTRIKALNDDEYEDVDSIVDGRSNENYITPESFLDRVKALKEIIPYKLRYKIAKFITSGSEKIVDWMHVCGSIAWCITTSIVLIGLPILYAYDREKSMLEYEKEQKKLEA